MIVTDEQKAAYIHSQVACAMIEMFAMKAANHEREQQGYAHAYGEDAFMELIDRYGISHNAVIGFFRS